MFSSFSPSAGAGARGTGGRGDEASCVGRNRVPNVVHQVWLGGTPKNGQFWAYILSLASVLLNLRPERHLLHHDGNNASLPQCARVLATPVPAQRPAGVASPTDKMQPRAISDLVRLDLLLKHGGTYLDLDVFAVRRLDALRRSCAAPVIAGVESRCTQVLPRRPVTAPGKREVICDDDPGAASYQRPASFPILTPHHAPLDAFVGWPATTRGNLAHAQAAVDAAGGRAVLNNGVLMSAPDATFLHVLRQLYREFPLQPKDTLFGCTLAHRLAVALPGLIELRPDLAPLPFRTREQCAAQMAVAPVWHVSGMGARTFRRNTLVHWGAMRRILDAVQVGLERRRHELNPEQIGCIETAMREMRAKYLQTNVNVDHQNRTQRRN